MKPKFHEDFVSRKLDPLDGRVADFDWEAVERALGEEPGDDEGAIDYQAFAFALRRVLRWLVARRQARGWDRTVGRRAIALAWIVDPSFIPGAPSLRRIEGRLLIPRNILSRYVAEATREFGLRNRGQSHGWNRKKPSREQADQWLVDAQGRPNEAVNGRPMAATAPVGTPSERSSAKPASCVKESLTTTFRGRSGSSPGNTRRTEKTRVP